jgi:hypothetical protein
VQHAAPHWTWLPVHPVVVDPQTPFVHVGVPLDDVHASHDSPDLPHALTSVPGSHAPWSVQQPPHDVPSQTHAPSEQWSPEPQEPVSHATPQPSSAPHALPAQLGVHPHVPAVPPPPHVNGAEHFDPAQHGWPSPPQVPQSPVPHVVPGSHATHDAPPFPHAVSDVPVAQAAPAQQPAHVLGSHVHAPATQRWPAPHAPILHTPPQPSLAPHALLAQLGEHGLVPQTLAPAPPQTDPGAHVPQSASAPHAVRSVPQRPVQSAGVGVHVAPSWAAPSEPGVAPSPEGPGEPPSSPAPASTRVTWSKTPPTSAPHPTAGAARPIVTQAAARTAIGRAARGVVIGP